MGRVETRLYKRRRRRAKAVRWLLIMMLIGGTVFLLWRERQGGLITERIGQPTSTPMISSFDKTVERREVTLAAETWYAIQTGVFSTEDAAAQKADAYAERGAPGTVVRQGEKWRVFIACYAREADASAVRTRLETNQQVETYLYAWTCPELRLRLTGMVGQLDSVEAGFTLITSTAAALRDAAINLDAGELTTAEAAAAAEALNSQIILWEDTVRSRFGKIIPDLVKDLLAITGNWDERYMALQSCEDATALSAELKAQAMGMFDEICTWRSELATQ